MSNNATRRKRIIAGVLAGALALSVSPILGLTGTAAAADPLPPLADPIGAGNFCEGAPTTEPFTDVQPDDPSFEEIACLVADGVNLTQGTTATTYSPNGTITRRQMALFLERLIVLANDLELVPLTDLPAYDGTPDFSDLADENPEFLEAIGRLNQAEIVDGFPDGTYRPGAPVSRRQMAAFINRTQDFLTGTPFSTTGDFFDDDNGDTGEGDLNALASVGIFQGDGAGNVFPGADLTRRQMANILLRHLQVNFDAGNICRPFVGPCADVIDGNADVNVVGGTVQPGGDLTGTVTGENIQSVRVSGCGLADQALPLNAGGGFSITVPASQPVGACVLTFVTTFLDGTTETDTVDITVTAPTTFFIGSPLTTQFNFASTGAAPNQGREEYTFTIPADFAGPVDITLVSAAGIRPTGAGVEFADANDNAQADNVGTVAGTPETPAPCGGFIELVEGVAPSNPRFINDQAIPADRVITVVVDSNTPNSACVVILFRDLGNDNALTLNDDDIPTEPFGIGGGKIWTGPEATFGSAAITVAIAVADAEADGQPVNALTALTAAGTRYEFDANDIFQLGGVVITQDQFESIIGTFDSLAIAYDPNPGGVSVFNITNDVGFAAPAAPSITVVNDDAGPTANDVLVEFDVPAFNENSALYEIQRANIAGGDGICGTADDVVAGSESFSTIATVQRLPDNTVSFTDLNVPNGCYRYRVQVTNPVSGIDSNSAVTSVTVPGGADAGAPTSVNAIADDNTFPGQLDSGDRISILFSEIVNAAAGDVLRVQDSDGEFANITLGTGNTFTAVTRGGQTLLTITLTAAPVIAGDALPAVANDGILELNLTITNQSGLTDPAGNNLNLAAGDVTIEADSTGPLVAADTADTGDTSFTVTFNEAVDTTSAETEANYTVATTCTVPNAGVNPVTNAVVSSAAGSAFTVVTLTVQNALAANSCLNQTVSDVIGNVSTQTAYALTAAGPAAPALVIVGAPTSTTEAGGTDTFTVALSTAPTSTVVVNVSSADTSEVTAAPVNLVFTVANFATPQTVTLTGVDDAVDDGNIVSAINLTTDDAATAAEFDAVSATVNNTNTDDDASPTFDSVVFAGNVATATFSEPVNCGTVDLADFTVGISGARAVTAIGCTGASDATIEVTFGGAASTIGDLNLIGAVADPEGNAAPIPTTRQDTTA